MWKISFSKFDKGRSVWKFDPNAEGPLVAEQQELFKGHNKDTTRNSGDKIYRHLAQNCPEDENETVKGDRKIVEGEDPSISVSKNAIVKGIRFYQKLQTKDGFWPGDYGGPMFLMPNLIICRYVTGFKIEGETASKMLLYLKNHQNRDGGWGTHIQSEESTMFGSVMNYVAARLLGESARAVYLAKARGFIEKNGGALYTPPWAKFWLCVLGVYKWEGLNSILPELWVLPEVFPIHPSRWWCHCRMVYLPMAFIYSERITFPENDLTSQLRKEIFVESFESIDFTKHRSSASPVDIYYKDNVFVLSVCFAISNFYESRYSPKLRSKATEFILDYIRAEDSQTDSIDIGPVNKTLNALCIWHADGPKSPSFQRHLERMDDYLWLAEDGMKMQGYNGSQLWDTAFAMMAISSSVEFTEEFLPCLKKAYKYVDHTQTMEDVIDKERYYRHSSKGGWPFSTKSHGWPISDCTSHGLYAVLIAHEKGIIGPAERIKKSRLCAAVDLILGYQNTDGGFPTYENKRGMDFLELLNPAVVFDKIMVDYSYVELTASAILALTKFQELHPECNGSRIRNAVRRGVEFIKKEMRPDGSWYGSWGVCFTYASFFAMKALAKCGEGKSKEILKASAFLVSHQRDDGGWGESYESCCKKQYVENESSQIVNTAWACIALMEVDYSNVDVIQRGVKFLRERQEASGDWSQEDISGVFNSNCMITYTAYRNVFPLWALALYTKKYEEIL